MKSLVKVSKGNKLMKTYRTPGEATDWAPIGDSQTVQITEEVTFPFGTGTALLMPVTLTAQAETSRKGIRRVLIKALASVPRYTGSDKTDAFSGAPISAHVVLTMPQALAQAGQDGTGLIDPPALLAEMLADIVAVASNKSLGYRDASGDSSNPQLAEYVLHALAGGQPLDPVSGSYGVASV